TAAEVIDILQDTATLFTVAPSASQPIGPGIVNAAAAVAKAIEPPCEVDCAPDATPIANGAAVTGLSGGTGSEALSSIEVPAAVRTANGPALSGLAGATGSETLCSVVVPAGVRGPLSIITAGGRGNVTLLVSLDEEPPDESAQSRSARRGNNDAVGINAPQAG